MFRIYTTNTCAYCKMVKKVLDEKKLSYEEVDIDQDEAAREAVVNISGKTAVPVLTRVENENEELVCVGWNPSILMKLS